MEIDARDWTEVMISDKVDLGDSLFTENFHVQSNDSDSAKRVVNEAIQATLIEHMSKPLAKPRQCHHRAGRRSGIDRTDSGTRAIA